MMMATLNRRLPMLDLTVIDALLALVLLAVSIVLSSWQKIGIELNLLVSFGRAILQLIVLAYLLALVFSFQSATIMVVVLVMLTLMSTQLLSNRIELEGMRVWAGGALSLSTIITVGYTILVVLRPEPWFSPQLWISLWSIVLVQNINTGAIAANHFFRSLQRNRSDVEMRLSLGATPSQAASHYRRSALRAVVLPNLATVAIAGLGSIPLFMSGLLVSGLDPLEAVLLELLLVLMLLCSGIVTSLVLTQGITQLSFTAAAQLREL